MQTSRKSAGQPATSGSVVRPARKAPAALAAARTALSTPKLIEWHQPFLRSLDELQESIMAVDELAHVVHQVLPRGASYRGAACSTLATVHETLLSMSNRVYATSQATSGHVASVLGELQASIVVVDDLVSAALQLLPNDGDCDGALAVLCAMQDKLRSMSCGMGYWKTVEVAYDRH